MLNLFYRNPRLLILALGLIVVVGLSSYHVLPRLEDPELINRVATVMTRIPGASAERVESLVTEKLEEKIREIEEVRRVESNSRSGMSFIVVELQEEVMQVEEVWSRVRNKIDDAVPELPSDASDPEFDAPDFKAYAMIVALRWDSTGEPNYAILRRQAEDLEDVLLAIPGTDKVELFGDPKEEVVVEVDPHRLAALGLTASSVSQQLQASDAKITAGQFRGKRDTLLIEVEGELDSVARIARTPIHYAADGRVVQLADVADIRKGIQQPPAELAVVDGRPAIAVGVMLQSKLRIDHWTQHAQQQLEEFEKGLSRGITLQRAFVQNDYVEQRLLGLLWNLAFGATAVVLVMLVMMGWRSALIVGVALPLTSLMVLAGLRFLGIPIQQMSVTGLVIALGLLIDNAIVVVDDVRERIRAGRSRDDAIIGSVRHLAVPLFGSTSTTALAFMPLALLPGGAGEFVGAIAISVILAIFSSLLLSLTIIPALTAHSDRIGPQDRRAAWWNHGFSHPRLTSLYRNTLDYVFARPWLGVAFGMALPVLGFAVSGQLAEQFFPPGDRDQCRIELELPAHSSLAETLQRVNVMRARMLKHPDVVSVDWFVGRSAPAFYYNMLGTTENAPYYAEGLVRLKSAEGGRETIRSLQEDLDAAFPGARALVRQLEQGPPFDAPVEIRLYGPDLEVLREKGEQLRAIFAEVPHVLHTSASLSEAAPKLSLRVDEEKARLVGLDHTMIARQLNATLEGAVGGSVLEETEELPVRVRLPNKDRGDVDRIASLNLQPAAVAAKSTSASFVPLETLASVQLVPEQAAIPRRDGQRVNVVKAYITAGVLPSEVLLAFRDRLTSSDFRLPPGYRSENGGEAAERNDAVGNLMANVGPLMVIMMATLVLSFGSFRLAGSIATVGALSVGLGFAMLWLFGYPFGFMAIVGTMGLVGVAINDSIVVLAALREDPEARRGERRAVREVVLRSTRHVAATSLTTLAGFMPLVLAGGGLWPPLAITIAGGVAGATLLALYFTPSAYVLLMCRSRCLLPESVNVVQRSSMPTSRHADQRHALEEASV